MSDTPLKFPRWTIFENNIIRKEYPALGSRRMGHLLPDRTEKAISHQARKLKVRHGKRIKRTDYSMQKKPMSNEALTAYWAAQPIDTRDLSSVLCGEPKPGRSALDRMEK